MHGARNKAAHLMVFAVTWQMEHLEGSPRKDFGKRVTKGIKDSQYKRIILPLSSYNTYDRKTDVFFLNATVLQSHSHNLRASMCRDAMCMIRQTEELEESFQSIFVFTQPDTHSQLSL